MIAMTWSDTFLGVLKDNDVRLVGYVPDNALTPVIKGVIADNYFMSVNATRDDEAPGSRRQPAASPTSSRRRAGRLACP
jgi:sulfopyruvate decarboxylase TPP-binding subunit